MKRTTMLLMVVLMVLQLCCSSLWARPRAADEAEKVVAGWLKTNARPLGTALGRQIIKIETFIDDNDQPVYYVVYLQPNGFVIVSADDLVEPIIAFADDGTFEPSLESPLGALVNNDLNGRITAVRNTSLVSGDWSVVSGEQSKSNFSINQLTAHQLTNYPRSKWRHLISLAEASENGFALMGLSSIPDVRVDPFVKSKWGQSDICGKNGYNYYTPNNYYCGCTATAMAQLMRYHEYPTASMEIGRKQFQIKVDGISEYVYTRGGDGNGGPYKWSLMEIEPGCSTTLEQRQAIGALCYDAAVAAQTEFSENSSASNLHDARDALQDTFMYKNAIRASDSIGNIGSSVLNNMVNTNLDAGYPVILGIKREETDSGHAVVADGYGYDFSALYHHLNMGWSGSYDIWYNLPNVDSSRAEYYDIVNGCIYNIFPSGSGEIISGRVTDTSGNPISDATVTAEGGSGPYTAVTNNRGIYALVKVGSYTAYIVSVAKSGYNFTSQGVSTRKSENSTRVSGNKWGIDFVGEEASVPPADPARPAPALYYSTEDFETDDFTKLPWSHSGDGNWTITTDEKYSGAYSAQAGSINHDESTTLWVRLDCIAGDITFYHKVSSELACDYLEFYIDGVRKGRWSGTTDWEHVSFPVTAGTRIFEWAYSKDGSISTGSDAAWIDEIAFPLDCGVLRDFDSNGQVNFIDFAFFASQWLGPRKAGTLQRGTPDLADLNGNGGVNFEDLDIFSENWLLDLTPCTVKQ
ncbi:MAG: C10 family peptidase [Planctomycetota bacterium]